MHRKFFSENQKEKIIEECFVVTAMIEMCFYHFTLQVAQANSKPLLKKPGVSVQLPV